MRNVFWSSDLGASASAGAGSGVWIGVRNHFVVGKVPVANIVQFQVVIPGKGVERDRVGVWG